MSSFEDAARRMLGAPPHAEIHSEWSDAGNDGCDTCGNGRSPSYIHIYAYWRERYPNGRLKKKPPQYWDRTFTTLPELWEALFPHDETDTQ